jgi:hypothetical protein
VCCQSYPVGPRGVAIAPAVFPTRSQLPRQPYACLPCRHPVVRRPSTAGASEPATGGTDASGPVGFAPVREAADEIVHLAFISMNPVEPSLGRFVEGYVDEEAILCAFTVDELERLADWGDRTGRQIDLEPPERELLERIKRLAEAARERQRRGRLSSLDRPRRHPS